MVSILVLALMTPPQVPAVPQAPPAVCRCGCDPCPDAGCRAGGQVCQCKAPKAVAVPASTRATECHRACVVIDNGHRRGSGTVVRSGGGTSLVLTCWHLFATGVGTLTVTHEGKVYPAAVHSADKDAAFGDGLVLVAVGAELPAAEIADTDDVKGYLRIWSANGAKGGLFSRLRSMAGYPLMESGIPSRSGDSGAGVFDASGKVVGVIFGHEGTPSAPGPAHAATPGMVRRILGLGPKAVPEKQLSTPLNVKSSAVWVDYPAAYASGKPVFVFVTADWCPGCKRMAATFADPEVVRALAGYACVTIDADRDAALATAIKARSLPLVAVYDAGRLRGHATGYQTAEQLRALLGGR
jgi:thiol-disulfide isomerase/thioredoxin